MTAIDDNLLEAIIQLAEQAGEKILEMYDKDYTIKCKEDETPLTEADMAAHYLIEAGLQKITPEIPILSEESASIPFEERQQWQRYWLVDPLDGTREFIKRNGEFSVNIALIEGGEAILGVVYAPVMRTSYYARRGAGAFKREPGRPGNPIHCHSPAREKVIVAGSRSHRGASLDAFLVNLPDYEIISMGSALKSCLVAEGVVDIYPRLGPTSEWDTAAAQCVVEEAGGRITDTCMNTLRYNTKDSLLNPHFFVFGETERDWSVYLAENVN